MISEVEGWIHEMKFDGYRIRHTDGDVPIVDGKVVLLDDKGAADFAGLRAAVLTTPLRSNSSPSTCSTSGAAARTLKEIREE